MTSKLKCPFCNKDLTFSYITDDLCCEECWESATEKVWQALTQAKQDLEIARKAFEMIRDEFGIENRLATPVMQGLNMKAIAEKALEQIKHKDENG